MEDTTNPGNILLSPDEITLESLLAAQEQARSTVKLPRNYQLKGIEYLVSTERALLSDPPSAGKTLQGTIAAQESTPPQDSILVVAPAHLCEQWFDEIHAQYPGDTIIMATNDVKAKRLAALEKSSRWIIVNTQMFRYKHFYNAIFALTKRSPMNHRVTTVLIDESHYMKNRQSQTADRVFRLVNPNFTTNSLTPLDRRNIAAVPRVYMLSATPIVREADDIYQQLHILDPIRFSSFYDFLADYCYATYTPYGPQNVTLKKSTMPQLNNIMLSRGYADIGLEIPPVVPKPTYIPLSPLRMKHYHEIRDWWITEVLIDKETGEKKPITAQNAMELMHILRHLTHCQEKMLATMDVMEDVAVGPFVIFTFYRDSTFELADALKTKGYKVVTIHGGVSPEERIPLARAAFHPDPTNPSYVDPNAVVIATIPSLRDGCDLSAASTVIFYEEDFTPGSMYQALSRVRRHRVSTDEGGRGLDNHVPVTAYHMLARNTIDQRIHAVQQNRAANVKDIIKVEMSN